MINTRDKTEHVSSNDIRELVIKRIMDSMSDEIANILFKHNRANKLFICFYNKQFHIDTRHVIKDRLFIYKVKNPKLTISGSDNVRESAIEQLLTTYFQLFSNTDLVNLVFKVDNLIDQETLKQWLITDYFTIVDHDVANYLIIHYLNEFAVYWLSNFNRLAKYAQKDQSIISEALRLFIDDDFKGGITVKIFICQLAKLVATTYPDYFCKSLIIAIMAQFDIKNDHQHIVLPFKYFKSYIEGLNYSGNRVNITFQLTTTKDLAQLMTVTDFVDKYTYHLNNQLKHCNELNFDSGEYKNKISIILSNLESIYHLTGNKDYLRQANLIQTLFKIKKEGNKDD